MKKRFIKNRCSKNWKTISKHRKIHISIMARIMQHFFHRRFCLEKFYQPSNQTVGFWQLKSSPYRIHLCLRFSITQFRYFVYLLMAIARIGRYYPHQLWLLWCLVVMCNFELFGSKFCCKLYFLIADISKPLTLSKTANDSYFHEGKAAD